MVNHWILDPRGHRQLWVAQAPVDGSLVDTVFGEAVAIVPPTPPDDDWYCDICNEPILTRWGEEPFPVPVEGTYALCLNHYERALAGRPMWEARFCACDACEAQGWRWQQQLVYGYSERLKEVVAQN